MAAQPNRSMNEQLKRGMLDGTVKNMRPDSAGAEYDAVVKRARALHPSHYGTFGNGSDAMTPFMEDLLPDASLRQRLRDMGVDGY